MASTLRGGHLIRLLDQWRATRTAMGDGNGGTRNGNGGPGRRPEYATLAAAISGLLRDGRVPIGVRLPAERELAEGLGISRTTVTAAYRELRESGHLNSRRGAGSFTTLPAGQRVGSSGLWTPDDTGDMIDLGCAALDAPAQLTDAVAAAVAELPRYTTGAGYHPSGLPALRERIADAFTARGLPTSPDQVLVTNGVQQAVDLILRLLVAPGQTALVESPTYPNALTALRAHRARIVTTNLDPAAGWEEELLLAEVRSSRPTVAYLIPEFQNPTGHVMPERLRALLPAAAHRAGTDLIVDESFVDLAFDTPLPPPVASFDAHARVLTVGGVSKPYWGGVRVGWIRAATPLIARLSALRVTVDMAGPVLDQLVAAAMLDRASEVIAARRRELRARRDTLLAALRQQIPQWTYVPPRGGVSLWVELDAPVSTALAQAAHEHGVRLAPGSLFGPAGTLERFMRLPFTRPEPDLVEAVRRLAAAHADLTRARPAAWAPPSLVA